jgi:DNA invertase Pin-like site-specific DNA recombinase
MARADERRCAWVSYLRVSTSEQAERDLSLAAQRRAAEEYAARSGQTIAREYIEEGCSGTHMNRKAFRQMLGECIDQYESEVNGMRTSAAMREAVRQGNFPGARTPFGFTRKKVEIRPGVIRSLLVPDDREAAVVRPRSQRARRTGSGRHLLLGPAQREEERVAGLFRVAAAQGAADRGTIAPRARDEVAP